jgi:hypothetical protein
MSDILALLVDQAPRRFEPARGFRLFDGVDCSSWHDHTVMIGPRNGALRSQELNGEARAQNPAARDGQHIGINEPAGIARTGRGRRGNFAI